MMFNPPVRSILPKVKRLIPYMVSMPTVASSSPSPPEMRPFTRDLPETVAMIVRENTMMAKNSTGPIFRAR